jgi:leucyl aminopeptidase
MNTILNGGIPGDASVDLLVVATGRDWKAAAEVGRLDRRVRGKLIAEMRRQGFRGAEGEVAVFQAHGTLAARHVLLCGVDPAMGVESWYKLADAVIAQARELKAESAGIALPAQAGSAEAAADLAEGLALGSYRFETLKSVRDRKPQLRRVQLFGPLEAGTRAALVRARILARATCYARDLINLPAGTVTPSYLGREARRIARAQRLRARIFTPRAIKRAGMGALLGVAQGSAQPPCFIELVYRPRAKARHRVALAGKGITFDSGGLSIKSAESMQGQKRDMAGGAAVLAVMSAVRDLGIAAEVRAYVPATENMPSGQAMKPGDVVRAYNGKTIEVLNTDAEGRLVLADALSYAAAAKPDVLIDLATLTAAVRTALGPRCAGIMGTDAELVRALIAAGRDCGEPLWELPLMAAYRSDLDSTVADIKNIGDGGAGTIVAGLFLREFTGGVPWAHIDFSSTAVTDKPFAAHPRGATGFGVRTLLRYLGALRD